MFNDSQESSVMERKFLARFTQNVADVYTDNVNVGHTSVLYNTTPFDFRVYRKFIFAIYGL